MVITVYISGISGNKEVKKRQQRVQMILESKSIEYEAIDIAEPGRQEERDRLKTCGAPKPALPPQLFNGDDYCGDYDQFDLANETDELEKLLKLPIPQKITNGNENGVNRISPEKVAAEVEKEASPVKETSVEKEESPEKEKSVEKEQSPEKEKSVEKEDKVDDEEEEEEEEED